MSSLDIKTSLDAAIKAHKSGDVKFAKALYVEVLSIDENNVQALCNLGAIYKQSGSYSLALSTLNKALSLDEKSLISYINLASLYLEIDSFDKAINTYKQALKISPKNANTYNYLAIAYEKEGEDDQALHFYKEAIRCDITFVKAYNNIGVILYKQGRYIAATKMFKMALDVDKNYMSTYVNLGAAYNKAKMYAEAEKVLLDVLMIDENNAGACANLGNVYNKMKKHSKAFLYHDRALSLENRAASNHANIGITYKNLSKFDKAKEALEKAIEINPSFVNAHFDLSTTYLLLGEYEKGFREYEWRFKKPEMQSLLHNFSDILKKPEFTLACDCKDKTLLLYSEQGFGDIIQFSRFVKELAKKHPALKIKIQVRPELKALFSELSFFDEVISREEEVGAFDYQLAVMSLAHLLKTTLETLPSKSYINVDGDISLDIDTKKFNIGIVWGASNTGESYEDKVFSLEHFRPLMDDAKIQLYSLQVAGDSKQIEELGLDEKEIINLEKKLTDFRQTAIMIEKLDLVITSDTSVAHLAGAMGKEAWVVLQKNADWRWGQEEETTVWYPTLKLFRQTKKGDWESAFRKVYTMIEKRTK